MVRRTRNLIRAESDVGTRIEAAFAATRREGRTGLIAFVTGGDPDLSRSAQVLLALDRAGADIIEVGVPFSDPIADGPVIQRASARALSAGATLDRVLELCAGVRPKLRSPLVLFSYVNPILRLGPDTFIRRAVDAGVDGLLVVDLPIEESAPWRNEARAAGIDQINLVSPTSSRERIRRTAAAGSGFLYAISTLGVTGARARIGGEARQLVERVRGETSLPVAVGFGVSHPDHVREIGLWADAAVVGSSIVDVVEKTAHQEDVARHVGRHVSWLLGRDAPAGE